MFTSAPHMYYMYIFMLGVVVVAFIAALATNILMLIKIDESLSHVDAVLQLTQDALIKANGCQPGTSI